MSELTSSDKLFAQFPFTLYFFETHGGTFTKQEAIWICDICGEITPRVVQVKGHGLGYLPEKCACQTREEQAKVRLEMWSDKPVGKCFTWLGDVRPKDWQTMMLATFQHKEDMQLKAYMVALDFIEHPSNLILWSSGYGSGKTHLATALCNHMQTKGWKCLFAACQDLFRAIEARWDKPQDYQDTYSDLIKQACSCDLLALDDLGRTGKYRKELDEIVDRRHNQSKPTVITLNADRVQVTDNDIVGISQYIGRAAADRLCDESVGGLIVCQMNGPSWRRKKR